MAPLNHIGHFVVLMLNNRSFDNLLGQFYPERADLEGLKGGGTNRDGNGNTAHCPTKPIGARDLWILNPDPSEQFADFTE